VSDGSARRIGEGLGLGVLGALIAALPAATRLPGMSSFIVLWASAALLVGPVAVGARLARTPASETTGRTGARASETVVLGALLAAPLLVVFGGVLKTTTHHRPLGAITFTLTACVVLFGAMAIAGRWLALARAPEASRVRGAARITLGLAAAGCLLVLFVSAFRALGDPSMRSLLVDAALLVSAVALAARVPLPSVASRIFERSGAVGWFVLIGAGALLGRSVALAESIASKAPLIGWLAGF